jgi:hypothetical protein
LTDCEAAGEPLVPGEAAEAVTPVDGPELLVLVPAVPHATTARAMSATKSPIAIQRARGMEVRLGEFMLANRVVATATPRVAAGDSTHSHPAPSKQTVFGDRLLGVDRT